MSEAVVCPKCGSDYTYENGAVWAWTQCFHEWNPAESDSATTDNSGKVLDSNGNELQNGDSVIVIKDLPVKGAPKPIKAGTKVKNIRLVEGDHDIDCKIEGFGAMQLKSAFVKKI